MVFKMEKKYIRDFRETVRIFEREIFLQNAASCCDGISLSQCHTLMEIEKNKDISVSELAQNMRLDKSTISRTVDSLVKLDYIERVIPEENRRMAILNLTDEGRQVCESINFSNDSYIRTILKDFSVDEQLEFLELFRKLSHNMVSTRKSWEGEGEQSSAD
jgi:DNA-binding MarR family transcriptional regulator